MKKTLTTTSALFALFGFNSAAVGHSGGPHTDADKQPSPKQIIRALDADSDGLISYEEFRLPEERRGANRLAEADTDGDGNVSRAEMEAQINEHLEAMKARAEARFAQTDLNSDGFVTPEERKQVAFESIDENGDGYLAAEELAKAKKLRKSPRG